MEKRAKKSVPLREPWIEIEVSDIVNQVVSSVPLREPWIEIYIWYSRYSILSSVPLREPWIEILTHAVRLYFFEVGSLAGAVD